MQVGFRVAGAVDRSNGLDAMAEAPLYRRRRCIPHPPGAFSHVRYLHTWNSSVGAKNVGTGTLLDVEQSALENRPGGGADLHGCILSGRTL